MLLALALVAGPSSGCGSGEGGDYGGSHPNYAKALAGSPPPLAALHKQANDLLPGGTEAYEARLAQLRGYPVVVNLWASWCGPCRAEFPYLQELSARYGKKVAFVGVNYQDSDDAAETFLGEAPLSYPSYTDPEKEIAESLDIHTGVPDTAFYGSDGKLLYLHLGQYRDGSELEADVRRYALKGG
ncbi:MAG TPA: TlpA disulfide reductase family protein [Solirubrobacterales bacterium]|nr:TlpA disulfide reductase family protein [Solirubrobacterales bacterium]